MFRNNNTIHGLMTVTSAIHTSHIISNTIQVSKTCKVSIAETCSSSDQVRTGTENLPEIRAPEKTFCVALTMDCAQRDSIFKDQISTEPIHQANDSRLSYQISGNILFPQESSGGMGNTKHLESSLDLFESTQESAQPTIALPIQDSNTTLKKKRANRRQKPKKNQGKKQSQSHSIGHEGDSCERSTMSSHKVHIQNKNNVVNVEVEQFAYNPPKIENQCPLTAPATSLQAIKLTEALGEDVLRVSSNIFTNATYKERLAIQLMEKTAEVLLEVSTNRHAQRLVNSLASPSFPSLAARMKVTFARTVALARGEVAQELAPPALQNEDVMTAEEAELFLAAFCEVRDTAGRVFFRRYFRVTEARVVGGERGVGAVAAAADRRSRLVSAFESKKARLDGLYSAGVGGASICLLAEVEVDEEGRGREVRWMEQH